MSGIEVRIALQKSRFNLIQSAADLDIRDDQSTLTRQLINTRLEVLENNWIKFQEDHDELCHSGSGSLNEHSYIKTRVFERCQAFYVYSRAKLLSHRDDFESLERNSRSAYSEPGNITSILPRSALPRINLPRFSGDYKTWNSFHDLFISIIKDNNELSNVEKMHYLKTCLDGEASRLISNLPLSGENFSIAWQMLLTRYENKRYQISAHLDKLTSLKPLKSKSSRNLSTFTTIIFEAIGALRALGCAVHHWDPLLLHLLVRLLDTETREAWEINLGSTTMYPTFKQFEDFLITRTRAMENLELLDTTFPLTKERSFVFMGKDRTKTVAHISTSFSPYSTSECFLCKSNHYAAKCDRYFSKTPQQRLDIIIKHRRCFNCLGAHTANRCHITKRCQKYGINHHTSIHEACVKNSSTTSMNINKNLSVEEEPSTSPSA